jgi:hypothetical protein
LGNVIDNAVVRLNSDTHEVFSYRVYRASETKVRTTHDKSSKSVGFGAAPVLVISRFAMIASYRGEDGAGIASGTKFNCSTWRYLKGSELAGDFNIDLIH